MKYTNMDNLLYINIYELINLRFILPDQFGCDKCVLVCRHCCTMHTFISASVKNVRCNLWFEQCLLSVDDYIFVAVQGCLQCDDDLFAFHMRDHWKGMYNLNWTAPVNWRVYGNLRLVSVHVWRSLFRRTHCMSFCSKNGHEKLNSEFTKKHAMRNVRVIEWSHPIRINNCTCLFWF